MPTLPSSPSATPTPPVATAPAPTPQTPNRLEGKLLTLTKAVKALETRVRHLETEFAEVFGETDTVDPHLGAE